MKGISLIGLMLLGGLSLSQAADQVVCIQDFDGDGIEERLVTNPVNGPRIQTRASATGEWTDAGYGLPDGVTPLDPSGADAGLRFVDLNDDGFPDLLFSNRERFAIYLWTKSVRPDLGWTRGWSQFVRAGERTGAPLEPPPLTGRNVFRDGADLVISSGTDAPHRIPARSLIAFDVPPPLSPEKALASFHLSPGFRIEIVASEPVVLDPVYFDWDEFGRLWVVEMRDYPQGIDGQGQPGGVIKMLVDSDQDGRYERAIPFLEGVPYPSSLMPWLKGLLIAAAPDLFYAEDTDGDGVADRTEVLFTGFDEGNQQHRFNGFEWGLDGWIYAANGDSGGEIRSIRTGEVLSISGRDFRFKPETGEIETVSAQTQFGRRRDDWGHWFGNNNPTWLWHVTLPEHYLRRNPQLAVRSVLHVLANYPDSTRVFPTSSPLVRPNQPWSLNHVTSACSPTPYRDTLFGPEFANSVFISEPVHNAIHQEVLERNGVGFTSRRAADEQQSEFLSSSDNWFRPITTRTGPDGALYIADMYRFVIEHPEWISPEMQSRLDLRAGEDKGRIYRVRPTDGASRPLPSLANLKPTDLAKAMGSLNGWQRDTAMRLLLANPSTAPTADLKSLLSITRPPQVRLQALATLGALHQLDETTLVALLNDPHPEVRCEALRQAESFASTNAPILPVVAALSRDAEPAVRLQVAFSLGAWPQDLSEPVLAEMAASLRPEEDTVRVAIMSSLLPSSRLFALLKGNATPSISQTPAIRLKPSSADRASLIAGYTEAGRLTGNPERGKAIFTEQCAPCHRIGDVGHEVGPDLAMVRSKPFDWLLTAILDPNQAIDPRYRAWTVETMDGNEWSGLLSTETANNIVLRLQGGEEHPILRSDIESIKPATVSLMPEGFESALDLQAMADLIAWIRQE